jgi:hypothetical protein
MGTKENFKFKDIKTYASTEWLESNLKKYRCVFDELEVGNIYCELSLFNKKFDIENWKLKLILKCFNDLNEEICELNCDCTIDKGDSIVYVREGWGVATPSKYWKSGTYRWEAFVEDELIGTKNFYIESQGLVDSAKNPYFGIVDVKLYEGPDSNVLKGGRKYSYKFKTTDTRYIWVELNAIKCAHKSTDIACELIFNFKTSSGLLKGTITKLFFLKSNDKYFNLSIGWGSDILGTWYKDAYRLEIIFMDVLVKRIPFTVEGIEKNDNESKAGGFWQVIKNVITPNSTSRTID